MIFDARSSSRRCTIVTVVANLVRKMASSIAESPPPTTAIGFSRKKNPSHVAQVDTPWPRSCCSEGRPSMRADAPVVTTIALARISRSPTRTPNGPPGASSTESASAVMNSAPKRSACSRNFIMSSGPRIPSGKPGKFSTSVVSMSCPPAPIPSTTIGSRFARPA
jgi:hypothetical protein